MFDLALSRIDFRTISVFISVVEHEGFSAAAHAADTSLSSITRDIAALETRLGMRLCRRGREGFALTSHGEEVYKAAKQLTEDVSRFETKIASTREMLPGALSIGLIGNMVANPNCNISATLAALHVKLPKLNIRISIHPASAIDMLVRERRINVGFTAEPQFFAPLQYIPAFDEVHGFFVSRDCPDRERIIAAVTAITDGHSSAESVPYVTRELATNHFKDFERRFNLRVTAIGEGSAGVLAGVAGGFGCGIFPVHVARTVKSLVALPEPKDGLRVPFYMVLRKDAVNQLAMKTFLRIHREAVRSPRS